ncbi:MAG: penicillin-binding protein 1C, partial [Pseudomonadota bacterium]
MPPIPPPAEIQPPTTRRRRALRIALPAVLALILVAALTQLPHRLDSAIKPPDTTPAPGSTVVVDRHGALIRAFTDDGGRWRLPVALSDVDPTFIAHLIAYEDKRFYDHNGIDPRAALRAIYQAARHGRIVSGASTLTMQAVRLATGNRERSAPRKLAEAFAAWQWERRLTKADILERYLATAPYGGNIEGVRAASLAWFGREPARLTLAQAALLIALPQSPEARRPDRHPAEALRARNRVIDRLEAAGRVSARDAREARDAPVPKVRREVPRLAPHLAARLASNSEPGTRIETTLDATWQAALEPLARHRAALTGPRASAAIVVADHATGALRAAVGSAGLLDSARAGFVDMTTALRSPGSALKPFIYGVAFDDGLVAPGTLIDDEPTYFSGYEPENFSGEYRGTVTVAEALRDSLNIPAVTLLSRLGPQRLAARLTAAGATVALPGEGAPGLALGLGGLGISLMDLAMLSTALASDGWPRPLHATGDGALSPASLLSRRAARNVAGILATVAPPRNGRMGELAYKTGTSYGHRDAWAVGFDGTHVIAVWVGRPDGTPIAGLTGWGDAASP